MKTWKPGDRVLVGNYLGSLIEPRFDEDGTPYLCESEEHEPTQLWRVSFDNGYTHDWLCQTSFKEPST